MGTPPHPDRVARLLFGSVRREILALLFGRAGERFYMRELVRVAGGGSGAVQRELNALTEAGLVIRESVGRQVFFSVNQQAPIYSELHGIVAKTAGVADVLRAALAPVITRGGISAAFVHGSVATGHQTAASDVDLIVIGKARLVDLLPPARIAAKRLGREVNPSVYTVAEFKRRRRDDAPFLKRVLAGPKVFIVGDDRELARLAR